MEDLALTDDEAERDDTTYIKKGMRRPKPHHGRLQFGVPPISMSLADDLVRFHPLRMPHTPEADTANTFSTAAANSAAAEL